MKLRLLHQVGHNYKWNLDSYEEEGCGSGLIFSPLHQTAEVIERVSESARRASLFDPQFYLPSSQKPKLQQYEFFPAAVGGGFSTTSFRTHASEVARKCIEFQRSLNLRQVVIPTRFIDQLYSDYIDRQRAFTVDAFVDQAGDELLCLSLAVTSAMIEDRLFRRKLLNWVTSYPSVDRLYLIYQNTRDTKQINDARFLTAAHEFFSDVQKTGLSLTVGYTNSECLMFSMLDDIELTVGAFENTRMFTADKFVVSEEERRGPRARIYLPGLMNWLQFRDAQTIRQNAPDIWEKVHTRTDHSERALAQAIEPTFNQPLLYRHYFRVMHEEIEHLGARTRLERIELLKEKVHRAKSAYRRLSEKGIYLERHGEGTHLSSWEDYLLGLK